MFKLSTRKNGQKQHLNKKKVMTKIMILYIIFLIAKGWLNNITNIKENITDKSSYSIMHSLHDIFSIVIYSCTHNIWLSPLIIHYNNDVLILPKGKSVMWDETLFNSGAKSRDIITDSNQLVPEEDMQVFSYSWYYASKDIWKYTVWTVVGISREFGEWQKYQFYVIIYLY